MEKLIASFKEPGRWEQTSFKDDYSNNEYTDNITGVELTLYGSDPYYEGVWIGVEADEEFKVMVKRLAAEAVYKKVAADKAVLERLEALYV